MVIAWGRSGGSVVPVGDPKACTAIALNGGLSILTLTWCEGNYVSAAD